MKLMDDLTYGPADLMVDVLFPMREVGNALREELNLVSAQLPDKVDLISSLASMVEMLEDTELDNVRALLTAMSDCQLRRVGLSASPSVQREWHSRYLELRRQGTTYWNRVSWMRHFVTNITTYRNFHTGAKEIQ